MRPVSQDFLETIRGSHKMVADARILTSYQTGVEPSGVDIPIVAGDVAADATAAIRSTLDMTTDGNASWSREPDGLLTPYGNEVFVRRGIEYGDGAQEWVSLGYFRITDVEQDDAPDGPIRIAASDRMRGLVDARLTSVTQFTKNATFLSVFNNLVHSVYPTAVIEFDFDATTTTIGRAAVVEEDRHAFLRDLVAARGKIMYFDHAGVLQIKDRPNPGLAVFDFNQGPGGVVVSQSRALSREGVYNGVLVTGESADDEPPVRALAFDNSPNSPTYWRGKFLRVPRFYSSPLITTTQQAQDAARAVLLGSLGLPYNINLSAVPNPALEVLDPVTVRNARDSALHVIESTRIPLVAEAAMTATTRDQTFVKIGTEE